MLQDEWKRIAAIHGQESGDIAAIWLALDKNTDVLHLYDCCVFRSEVFAVIAEGLVARGRWIPIAWTKHHEELAKKLLDRGCNMTAEGCADKPEIAEVISREVWERLRTGRFRVDSRLKEWLDEYQSFYRKDAKVPLDGHPLMSATRHAVELIGYARSLVTVKSKTRNAPKVAIV